MAQNIRAELKRLQRRKQLQYSTTMENSDGSSSGGEASDSSPKSERALFTFKQVSFWCLFIDEFFPENCSCDFNFFFKVGLICERMLREKESEIREEYDNVLTAKLAEQYDAFVKFTYDQIHRNYQAAPSCKYIFQLFIFHIQISLKTKGLLMTMVFFALFQIYRKLRCLHCFCYQ